MTLSEYRFNQFSDDELYILKRALIEASKYIYMEEKTNYDEKELKLFDNLLAEAIDNIKWRESHSEQAL